TWFRALSFSGQAAIDIATLSLHDALPIWRGLMEALYWVVVMFAIIGAVVLFGTLTSGGARRAGPASGRRRESWWASGDGGGGSRSEEHTSELQSRENLVCRLLLEKKNTAL